MTSVLLYNRRLFVFPCHDVDQKYSVLLSILTQEELEENELTNKFDDYIYIQSCLLFSQGDGTRRIRVHNLCLPVSSNNKDIFESIDVECLSAFYAQKLTHLIYRTRNLTNSVIQIENNFYSLINEYFNNSNSLKRELNSKMQLFILYFLGILKLNLFNRNNDKGYLNDIDLSNYFRLRLLRSNVEEIIVFIYPRIYILDECIELKKGEFPEIINDSIEFFNKGNLFLIDNGFYFILYFKKNIYNIICQDIFGVNSFDEINYFEVNESTIFDNDNNYGKYKMKISEIINGLRSTKSLFQDLYFVFEGINDENIFKELLIENNYNKTYPFDYNTFYDKIISGNYK
jgi:protein transport protein SEC24